MQHQQVSSAIYGHFYDMTVNTRKCGDMFGEITTHAHGHALPCKCLHLLLSQCQEDVDVDLFSSSDQVGLQAIITFILVNFSKYIRLTVILLFVEKWVGT